MGLKTKFLFTVAFLLIATRGVLAVEQTLYVTAQIDPITDISVVTVNNGALTGIRPAYSWVNTPNVVPANQDPWRIAAPVKVTLRLNNNATNQNLYIYTQHRKEMDRRGGDTRYDLSSIPTTVDLAGILNYSGIVRNYLIKPEWIGRAKSAMVAWVDDASEGQVTSNATANWVWVLDGVANHLPLLTDDQKIINKDIDFYIRSAWNAPKSGGQYEATLYLSWESQ